MYKSKIIKRICQTIDTGTMGFHDYEKRRESINDFVERVTSHINYLGENSEIINVQYLEDKAIITYKNKTIMEEK